MNVTGKQMAAMSDLAFAVKLLQEKLDRMDNPYTPLASKLRATINALSEIAEQRKASTIESEGGKE